MALLTSTYNIYFPEKKLEMCQYDTDAPAQGHPHSHAGILQKMKLKRAITLILIGRFYPKSNLTIFYDLYTWIENMNPIHISIFFKTRKMPNALWTGFSKGQWKGKLGRPNARRPWHHYFKGQIYEKSVQNSILAAQAFGFRYLTKKVSVVSLIQGMPSCPYLCLYQILSKYFKPFRSMKCTRIWLRNSFRGVNLKK